MRARYGLQVVLRDVPWDADLGLSDEQNELLATSDAVVTETVEAPSPKAGHAFNFKKSYEMVEDKATGLSVAMPSPETKAVEKAIFILMVKSMMRKIALWVKSEVVFSEDDRDYILGKCMLDFEDLDRQYNVLFGHDKCHYENYIQVTIVRSILNSFRSKDENHLFAWTKLARKLLLELGAYDGHAAMFITEEHAENRWIVQSLFPEQVHHELFLGVPVVVQTSSGLHCEVTLVCEGAPGVRVVGK
jgi:hypothetical protein